MNTRRRVLLATVLLLNLPWLISFIFSNSVGDVAHNLDLSMHGYSGCKCNDCLDYNLTWSKAWALRPDYFVCGNGRRAQADLNSMLFIVSVPFAIAACVPPRKHCLPDKCECGYSRDGLPSDAICPECGATPTFDPDKWSNCG